MNAALEHISSVLNNGIRKIGIGDLEPGMQSPYDIIDSNGKLVLRKGHRIPNRKDALRQLTGCFFNQNHEITRSLRTEIGESNKKDHSLKGKLDSFKKRLSQIHREILGGSENISKQTYNLVEEFSQFCQNRKHYTIIGHLGMDYASDPTLVRPFHTAAILNYLSDSLNLPENLQRELTAASLTQYISILGLQRELDTQKEKLTESQADLVLKRASASRKLLETNGVNSQIWLNSISRQESSEMYMPAEILKAIDSYSGIVRPRRCLERPANLLFSHEHKDKLSGLNKEVIDIIIDKIGPYAPGNLVEYEIENDRQMHGSIAVVKENFESRLEAYVINNGQISLSPRLKISGKINKILHPKTYSRYNNRIDSENFWRFQR